MSAAPEEIVTGWRGRTLENFPVDGDTTVIYTNMGRMRYQQRSVGPVDFIRKSVVVPTLLRTTRCLLMMSRSRPMKAHHQMVGCHETP